MNTENLHTKQDFQNLMLELLNPLKPFYSEGRAGIHLGVTSTNYDEKAILMEAFSRPLWALVPFYAGGGREDWFADAYRRGLVSGTNPQSEEYWGNPGEYDQRFVEMAAMAYALLFAPETFWEPLTASEQDGLADYLYTINDHEIPCCNWQMFRVLVNIALKKVGKRYSPKRLEESLALTESYYRGDGWYQDGDSGQKDYYVPFAIHFYSLVYARAMEQEDPERCRLFRDRAMLFAKQFIYWFDEDGEALPFGRSLTYRFAQVSFFSACLLAGIEPFPVPVMKGLIVRHLRYWLSQPIFDRDNVLTIGYAYPNLVMAEKYNGPGSAYWSMKTFAFLLLPDEHPFWTAEAAPMPELADTCPMPYADMLVRRYPHHVTAYAPGVYSPNGHGQIVSKYGKFAYDTKFGFSVAKSCYELYENCPDSMLAFFIDGYCYVRRICEESEIRENEVWSRWSPYPGIMVETTVVPLPEGHKRIHRIESAVSCEAYDCGFSVAANLSDEFSREESGRMSQVANKRMACRVEALGDGGEGVIITADPNTNVLYAKTLLPAVRYTIRPGVQVLETLVTATV
ncbi:MAG: DUF2264 domain-containing protein [Eubacteriales bacterium]|nr:DUF2264 domain-containing protein [Eubacteriales bacterium]